MKTTCSPCIEPPAWKHQQEPEFDFDDHDVGEDDAGGDDDHDEGEDDDHDVREDDDHDVDEDDGHDVGKDELLVENTNTNMGRHTAIIMNSVWWGWYYE